MINISGLLVKQGSNPSEIATATYQLIILYIINQLIIKQNQKESLQIHLTCCILGPFKRFYVFSDSFQGDIFKISFEFIERLLSKFQWDGISNFSTII